MAIIDPPMVHKLMLVPENNVFIGAQPGSALVIHKTASGTSAEQIANFFINDPGKKSAHFVIGQDGEIVQCVHLVDGAGANCCVETGYDPYWNPLIQKFGNLNRCTISIEHCDPASDNSTPLTSAQKASSFTLVKWLVDQYGFDIKHDIKGHNSIDPIDRARCPGNYPWDELFAYLENGGKTMGVPQNWHDDGHTLTAPNGVQVVLGFRAYVLSHTWDASNWPLGPQYYTRLLEDSNPELGDGDQIIFRRTMLGYPHNPQGAAAHWKDTVIEEYIGTELAKERDTVARYYTAIGTLTGQLQAAQQQIQQLQSQQQGNPQDHALLLQVKQLVAPIS